MPAVPVLEVDGRRVRLRREKLRLGVRQVARLTGLPNWTIYEIEAGNRQPLASTLMRICRALDCTAESVCREVRSEPLDAA